MQPLPGRVGSASHVINFIHVQAVFQRRQRDDRFENGAGRVIFIRRAIFLRLEFLQLLRISRAKCPAQNHSGQTSATTPSPARRRCARPSPPPPRWRPRPGGSRSDSSAARWRSRSTVSTTFSSGLRLAVHVLRLAVAHVVHQHGFLPGAAVQLGIEFAFDARHADVIRQPVIEKRFFISDGTVVLPQFAEQMRRRVPSG